MEVYVVITHSVSWNSLSGESREYTNVYGVYSTREKAESVKQIWDDKNKRFGFGCDSAEIETHTVDSA